jgi:hypothetical protein
MVNAKVAEPTINLLWIDENRLTLLHELFSYNIDRNMYIYLASNCVEDARLPSGRVLRAEGSCKGALPLPAFFSPFSFADERKWVGWE